MHRVVNRSTSVTRHSIVFFCNSNFDALVETIVPGGSSSGGSGSDGAAGSGAAAAGSGADGSSRAPHSYPPVLAGKYILEKLGLMWD